MLRDYGEANVREGAALIAQRGLAGIARFANADAFDRASLEAIEPKPTIGIVSGLYELFADNALVGESLAGLGGAIAAGGFLVYTCQPWHPQLELIARALTSHRGGDAMGDAPANAGRDGSAGRARRFSQGRPAHQRRGTVHGVARRAARAMSEALVAAAASGRPWGRAFGWLAFLGPFFFATYGFATWVTAQRPHVGALVFDWERTIPFLPWTIVPYWSIDLLYGLSLFTCTDRRELDTHAKRLLTAQVIAVCCFLLFPLTFTFERPIGDGVFGWLFQVLGLFDRPFNQAPSLHVALLVILWAQYARVVTGKASRFVLHGWFALIGVSILTTWQHHFIDMPTGALLGFFCVWLWPQDAPSPIARIEPTSDPARRRLAVRYALGCDRRRRRGARARRRELVAAVVHRGAIRLSRSTTRSSVPPDSRSVAAASRSHRPRCSRRISRRARANVWIRTRGHAPWAHVADDVWIGRLPHARRARKEPGSTLSST